MERRHSLSVFQRDSLASKESAKHVGGGLGVGKGWCGERANERKENSIQRSKEKTNMKQHEK